ncbi:MAG: hypothetical protein HFJ09_08855 [Lachnospiraceae bacterium]|nr:hypothetical protein [Lachnospiraceae bacterium]
MVRKKICCGILLMMLLSLTACGKTNKTSEVSIEYPQGRAWRTEQRNNRRHWQGHDHHSLGRMNHNHYCNDYCRS